MEEITIKDIAKKCGVGVSTVSRAINNHPNINPDTRAHILKVIQETGYVPNNSARNLKRTDAKCIAVLMKGVANPLFAEAVAVIEEVLKEEKYALVLQHVEAYENELDVAFELIKEKRLRGIIFLGGAFYHDREELARLNVPFVFYTIIGEEEKGKGKGYSYSCVSVDDRAESRKMTEYLLELGHKRIAFLTEGAQAGSVGQLRLEGYKDALRHRGIEVDEKLICEVQRNADPYSMQNGYNTTKQLLQSKAEFTALFAIADFLAVGACRALHEAGLRIPEDVSVAGFDGIPLGAFYVPQLTTISQPVERMARQTVRLLLDVIDGEAEHEHVIFPASLTIRESTRAI